MRCLISASCWYSRSSYHARAASAEAHLRSLPNAAALLLADDLSPVVVVDRIDSAVQSGQPPLAVVAETKGGPPTHASPGGPGGDKGKANDKNKRFRSIR